MYYHISLRIWTPFPLRSPLQSRREGERETYSLFALKQREGKGERREKREERSMISFDSVQWRALSLPRWLASFHTIGRPYLPL